MRSSATQHLTEGWAPRLTGRLPALAACSLLGALASRLGASAPLQGGLGPSRFLEGRGGAVPAEEAGLRRRLKQRQWAANYTGLRLNAGYIIVMRPKEPLFSGGPSCPPAGPRVNRGRAILSTHNVAHVSMHDRPPFGTKAHSHSCKRCLLFLSKYGLPSYINVSA